MVRTRVMGKIEYITFEDMLKVEGQRSDCTIFPCDLEIIYLRIGTFARLHGQYIFEQGTQASFIETKHRAR